MCVNSGFNEIAYEANKDASVRKEHGAPYSEQKDIGYGCDDDEFTEGYIEYE